MEGTIAQSGFKAKPRNKHLPQRIRTQSVTFKPRQQDEEGEIGRCKLKRTKEEFNWKGFPKKSGRKEYPDQENLAVLGQSRDKKQRINEENHRRAGLALRISIGTEARGRE